jgi:hypothetical protein
LGLIVAPCYADVPDVVFEIQAISDRFAASFEVLAEWGDYDPATQTWTWTLPEAVEFWDGGAFLGSLDELDATVVGDPQVDLSFAVQSGPSDTVFFIASALLDYGGGARTTRAGASFTLTDFDGGSATLTGIGDTGGGYLAQYNGWAGDPFGGPQGTTFAEGIYSMNAGFFETVTEDFNYPESGWAYIGEPVIDMSSLVSFTLSAQDLASGTSTYVLVPEPASLLLLAFGGVAAFGRRRR